MSKVKTKQKEEEKDQDYIGEDQCHHYWVIEVANGPKSTGVCRYCGEKREFLNSIPVFTVPKRTDRRTDAAGVADDGDDEDDWSGTE